MDDCSPLSTPDQESIDKVVTQISPHQKTMDPSSVNFVYQWMFSMMASALNFNRVPNNSNNNDINEIKTDDEDSCNENKKDNFIRSLGNIRLSASSEFEKNEQEHFYNNDSDEDSDTLQEKDECCEHINQQCNKENNNNNMLQQQPQQEHRTNFFNNILNLSNSAPRKTLILDLDETLVHSTMKPVSHHHLTVNVLIESSYCTFYVIKRPHVDYFIQKVSQWYDVVIFTASMQQYADPLLDQLDVNKVFKKRLFRDSCLEKDGNYIKDLSMINQDLTSTIIIDNSPIAYSNNLENALPIDNWMGDMESNDTSLLNLLPFLEIIRNVTDVRSILSLRLLNPSMH
ncbi:hypothetical protein DICPUDRAFT_95899 [Dictyostelium purpureum]|uniref:FCP1 homology domain-containing protein n=1 Tax=Dictyostelium purpureum TaxID=5786 RepID=F1A2C2_DICPU|nr:uncharacterized protein DICPUDRAFT_95899 [Dictyostelium purpureum]EGC29663.1 hypothetical protein DICPUDRAFT_95899 [Dictyostelium purpureum]|eukprot:XP_003293816.1 hypothetical protein DICPUDRAFT_95899 [Dictyostelium purpureum]